MSIIDVCVDKLVHAIKNGVVYKQYCTALEEIKAVPGLKEQVDELRKLNYQIQAEGDDINLYDAIDDIDSKMDELCRIPERCV